jgi:hypothetical protein
MDKEIAHGYGGPVAGKPRKWDPPQMSAIDPSSDCHEELVTGPAIAPPASRCTHSGMCAVTSQLARAEVYSFSIRPNDRSHADAPA